MIREETIKPRDMRLPVEGLIPSREMIVKQMAANYGFFKGYLTPLVVSCAEVAEKIFYDAVDSMYKREVVQVVYPAKQHFSIYCPACQKRKIHISNNFCPNCGRPIEWIK